MTAPKKNLGLARRYQIVKTKYSSLMERKALKRHLEKWANDPNNKDKEITENQLTVVNLQIERYEKELDEMLPKIKH